MPIRRLSSLLAGILLSAIVYNPAGAQSQPQSDERLSSLGDTLPGPDMLFESIDIFSVGLETLFAPGMGSFFEEYRAIGGSLSNLDAAVSPTASVRIALFPGLRINGTASYLRTGFTERYFSALDSPTDQRPMLTGSVAEDFSLEGVPLTVGLQYSPVPSQFTSYFGIGFGGAIVSYNWRTLSESIGPVSFYRPQRNSDEMRIVPVGRAYLGLDLRFDRFIYRSTSFRGIFMELAWSWIGINEDWFREIRALGRGFSELPGEDEAYMNVGGVSLTLGANLQFYGSHRPD